MAVKVEKMAKNARSHVQGVQIVFTSTLLCSRRWSLRAPPRTAGWCWSPSDWMATSCRSRGRRVASAFGPQQKSAAFPSWKSRHLCSVLRPHCCCGPRGPRRCSDLVLTWGLRPQPPWRLLVQCPPWPLPALIQECLLRITPLQLVVPNLAVQ